MNANENQKRNIEFKSTVLFQKYAFENAIPNENATSLFKIYVRLTNFSILPVASFEAKGAPFELAFILKISRGNHLLNIPF